MVILGWILEKPLPLLFDPFESVVSLHSPLVVLAIFMIRAQVLYISGMFTSYVCHEASLTVP
jgi:hypothetical protein